MRKKYLSALLFGALLFASAGTFTSCKDYDDDINGLREDVTSLQNAVTTLQNAVENGKYVSAVSNNGNTITFTFTDGTTTDITLEDEKGSVVTVNADGVLCIDGEPTDIKAATDPTPGEEQKDQIIIENNMWSVLQEDGTYKSTGIPVSGINVAGSEADGYTFTIYAADGSSQTVKLPSAASAITEMTLGDKTLQEKTLGASGSTEYYYSEQYLSNLRDAEEAGTPLTNVAKGAEVVASDPSTDFLISRQDFVWHNYTGENNLNSSSAWMGNEEIPSNGSYVYSSPTSVDLRMDPVDVPANNLQFYLTDSKNSNLSPVVLTASASQDSNDDPMNAGDVNGRAAVTGNGLWTLKMENQVVSSSNNGNYWKAIEEADTKDFVYAVNANNAFRSKYELTIQKVNPELLTGLKIKGVEGTFTFDVEQQYYNVTIPGSTAKSLPLKSDYATGMTTTATDQGITYKTNTAYKVNAVEGSALYDMYLTADDNDIEVYGLTFNQDNHTFTIGKNPDVSSIPAEFDLIIYTVANNGDVRKTTVTIVLNSQISTPAEYSLISHSVNQAQDSNNFFTIDLATMKTALGGNLNQWMQNVDLARAAITYGLYTDESCDTPVSNVFDTDNTDNYNTTTGDPINANRKPLEARIVAENTWNAAETTDRNKANFIRINVNNDIVGTYNGAPATANKLQLDKTYYVKVEFKATAENGAGKLNEIIVPVEFTAPKLADLFTIKEGYQSEGSEVINAYFYQIRGEVADGIKFSETTTQVYLDRFFSAYVPMANVAFANGNVGETGHDGEWLFDLKKIKADGSADASGAIKFSGEEKGTKTHLALNFDKDNKGIKDDGGVQNGYNQVVTLDVEKDYFNTVEGATNGWRYTQDGDNEYSFQIRLMSPIREGKVVPAEGTAIDIDGNDLATGASITNDMIEGRTYNNVRYSIVPDAGNRKKGVVIYETAATNNKVGAEDYLDPQIQKVVPNTDDNNYLQSVQVFGSYTEEDVKVPGELKLKSSSISRDMTIQLPIIVTDAWNVVLEQEVPVSIKFNN